MATETKTTTKKKPVKKAVKAKVQKNEQKQTPKESVKAPSPSSKESAFAVVETGGKQYKVREGDFITVEKLEGNVGDSLSIETVLLFDDGKKTEIGEPYIKNKKVETEITELGKLKKINVIRFKSKSRHYKKKGHRQPYTTLKIVKI